METTSRVRLAADQNQITSFPAQGLVHGIAVGLQLAPELCEEFPRTLP